MIIEHNVTTGEIIKREMNEQELAQSAKDQATEAARQEVEAQKAADKAELLEKIGITEEEAKLLLS